MNHYDILRISAKGRWLDETFFDLTASVQNDILSEVDNLSSRFLSSVLESNINEQLKFKFISFYLSKNPTKLYLVPHEYQTEAMIDGYFGSPFHPTGQTQSILNYIRPDLLTKDVYIKAIGKSHTDFDACPEGLWDADILDVQLNVLKRASLALEGLGLAVLNKFDFHKCTPEQLLDLAKANPKIITFMPGELMFYEIFRLHVVHNNLIGNAREKLTKVEFHSLLGEMLIKMGIALEPSSILKEATKIKDMAKSRHVNEYIAGMRAEDIVPHARTEPQKILLAKVFGGEEVLKYHKLAKESKRAVLKSDLAM